MRCQLTVDGVVTEILVANQDVVEYGQGLGTYQMIDIFKIKEALPHRYPMFLGQ